eukprot:Clim_evm31s243 gene=Clim_evmTU31s243
MGEVEVHYRNKAEFDKKLAAIKADGHQRLQFITDFDMTLTKYNVGGVKGSSSHGIVENCPDLSKEYHAKAHGLFETYYPIEIDPNLTNEEKYPKMVEWWSKAHDALIEAGMRREYMERAVKEANLAFRNGVETALKCLRDANVPVLVFSAGLGDVIDEIFKQYMGGRDGNTHIIANWMKFNDNGLLIDFQGEIIHVFNKKEQTIHGEFAERVRQRQNVILCGDSQGDVHMADGVEAETVLKIGFLNHHIEKSLPIYKGIYDVVITNDAEFSFVNDILKQTL